MIVAESDRVIMYALSLISFTTIITVTLLLNDLLFIIMIEKNVSISYKKEEDTN